MKRSIRGEEEERSKTMKRRKKKSDHEFRAESKTRPVRRFIKVQSDR